MNKLLNHNRNKLQSIRLRKVKVRYHNNALNGLTRQEQFIPTDWIVVTNGTCPRLLPDNIMHRSPYLTIHIIVNQLASLCMRDVSRVKRLNAQNILMIGIRMMVMVVDPLHLLHLLIIRKLNPKHIYSQMMTQGSHGRR